MEELPTPLLPETRPKRLQLLLVLCILTFIGSGMSFLSFALFGLFNSFFHVVAEVAAEKFDLPGMELLVEAPPSYFLINALLFAGSISGAVMMLALRKAGFHVYTISQILLLIAPMYFLKLPGPSMVDLVISGIFIILYSTQLKHLK